VGLLASLFSGPILTSLVNSLIGPLEKIYGDYIQGKISKEQLAEQLQAAMVSAFAQIEAQFLDSITKTYTTFIQTASQNPVMTRAWAAVLYSQLFVLIWHQWVIPLLVLVFDVKYPSSGVTVNWSYALIALCLGAPQIISRIGPAASWASDSLKRMVGK
jgi:hypothetical protein